MAPFGAVPNFAVAFADEADDNVGIRHNRKTDSERRFAST